MKQKETSNQFKPKQSPSAVVDAHRAATFSQLKLLPEQEPLNKILVISCTITRLDGLPDGRSYNNLNLALPAAPHRHPVVDARDGPTAADALAPRRVRAGVGGRLHDAHQGGNSIEF